MPRVSVLMSVYNNQDSVATAIQSILGQAFTDFELLIADDASTDQSAAVIRTFTDPRIRPWFFTDNNGLEARLNFLAQQAKGEILARMDADDVSHPARLAEQMAFLHANPQVDVLGSGFLYADTGARVRLPQSHDAIAARLLFTPGFAHPTVVMRRAAFRQWGPYPALRRKEDYGLWLNALHAGAIFANLPQPLLTYRRPLFAAGFDNYLENLTRCHAMALAPYLGRPPTDAELQIHLMLTRRTAFNHRAVTRWALTLLTRARNPWHVKEILFHLAGYYRAFWRSKGRAA